MALNFEVQAELLSAIDHREFLRIYMERGERRRLSYTDIATRAGLASRSFVSNILSGERKVTLATLPKFKLALRLRGMWAQYFETLVQIHEPKVRTGVDSTQTLQRKLGDLRLKIQTRSGQKNEIGLTGSASNQKEQADALFSSSHVFDLYAALGSPERGASVEEICAKTDLHWPIALTLLEKLTSVGCVKHSKGRYFATSSDLDFSQLGQHIGFMQAFRESLDIVKEKSKACETQSEELYFHTAFAIPESQMPLLASKVRALLLETIDQVQVDDGERIVRLTLGMH